MSHSNGTLGEQLMERWFARQGWHMSRHQPPVRIVGKGTEAARMVYVKGGAGIADYTGYQLVAACGTSYCEFRAVEVKECYEDTMPASRLSARQREYMSSLPAECAYVGIVWTSGNPEAEAFEYRSRGSYHRGEGWR